MRQRALSLTSTGLVSFLLLFTTFTRADTLLVGTSLTPPLPAVVLCPNAPNCVNHFSGFSTSQPFTIDDIKVLMSGPAFFDFSTDGSFQVNIVTQLDTATSTTTTVGSDDLPFTLSSPAGSVSQVFDFSGLSIPLTPGTQYYLEVTGANLLWDVSKTSPLTGSGAFGPQLLCIPGPPSFGCSLPISDYGFVTGIYALQIYGDSPTVATTPEPSSLLLLATGIVSVGVSVRNRSRRQCPPLSS
jgi:hypothetical protein